MSTAVDVEPVYAARGEYATVTDAIAATAYTEALAMLFEDLALAGASVPEIVAQAAYAATERLPRGMSLTDARPGCWESACFEPMIPESAVLAGPGAEPMDIECDRCGAQPQQCCWNLSTYADNKHPHAERIRDAKLMTTFDPRWGWSG